MTINHDSKTLPHNSNGISDHEEVEKLYAYSFRSTLAQGIATFVVGTTYLSVGAIIAMPTIVVGNLLDSKGDLSLDEEQASWFGGLPFLLQPVGALLGIFLQDYFGQRYGLILSNFLAVISFLLLYYASTSTAVLTSAVLMGLSLGFTEPSGMGYISEYSEPRLRGFLCSGTFGILNFGILVEHIIVSVVQWRTAILITIIVPVLSVIMLILIPDSPVWLLSKGKTKKSKKALRWFRGWVSKDDVDEEFEDLCSYVKNSLTYAQTMHTGSVEEERVTLSTTPSGNKTKEEKSELSQLLSAILEWRTLYPLFLISVIQLIMFLAVSIGARIYIINLTNSLHVNIDKDLVTIISSSGLTIGSFLLSFILKHTGKRKLTLVGTCLASIISVALGVTVFFKNQFNTSSLFLILFSILLFVSSLILPIPWLLMGEIFPVRTRSAGGGLAGAIIDVEVFAILKTHFTAHKFFGTDIFFIINGVCGFLGCIYMYFYLPETEGKTLAQIEKLFSK